MDGEPGFCERDVSAMKRGIDWLLGEMDANKNLFRKVTESLKVYGLNAELIDVAGIHAAGSAAAARIAEVLNDTDAKDRSEAGLRLERQDQSTILDRTGRYVRGFLRKQVTGLSAAAEGAIKQIVLGGAAKLPER